MKKKHANCAGVVPTVLMQAPTPYREPYATSLPPAKTRLLVDLKHRQDSLEAIYMHG